MRERLPRSRQAGTPAGLRRARSIARGELQPAREVRGWFRRRRESLIRAQAAGLGIETSRALLAGDLWGGEAMASTVEKSLDVD